MLDLYDDLLTVQETMDILQVGKNQVYALLTTGEIKAFRIGKRNWKIPKESVILYIKSKANLL